MHYGPSFEVRNLLVFANHGDDRDMKSFDRWHCDNDADFIFP